MHDLGDIWAAFWTSVIPAFIGVFVLAFVPGFQWLYHNVDACLLLGGVLSSIAPTVMVIQNINEDSRGRQEAQQLAFQARREQEASERARQNGLLTSMRELVQLASTAIDMLPRHLETASSQLNVAEEEFAERAFAPFWAAVECASNALASYSASIDSVEKSARNYQEAKKDYHGRAPSYEVATAYPDPSYILERMKGVVRRAQKDFQFSAIYEQRKTNSLLQHGFMQLASSLDSLGDRFEWSIDRLGGRVVQAIGAAAEAQIEALGEVADNVREAASAAHEDSESMHELARRHQSVDAESANKESRSRREFERDASEKLDNIQRHRNPDRLP